MTVVIEEITWVYTFIIKLQMEQGKMKEGFFFYDKNKSHTMLVFSKTLSIYPVFKPRISTNKFN